MRKLVIFGMVFMGPSSSICLFGIMDALAHNHVIISYAIAFVAMMFTGVSYGKMAKEFPVAGSTYSYTQHGIDPKLGFLAGWVMLLSYFLIPLLLYVNSAWFATAFIPSIPFWGWILIYIIPVTIINLCGIESVSKFNDGITILMVVVIVTLAVCTVRYFLVVDPSVPLFNLKAIYDPQTFDIAAVLTASSICVLSYLGFDAITTLAEEATTKEGDILKAIILACSFQTIIYIVVSYIGTMFTPDWTVITDANINNLYFDISLKAGGPWMQSFLTILIILSGAATALTGQAAASRLLFGMGRDKLIPSKFFAYLHPKYNTPSYSIILMAVTGLIGSLTIPLEVLVEIATFGALFGFICVNLSVFVYKWVKQGEKKLIGHLISPLLGVITCAYILFNMATIGKLIGFSWTALGIIYLVIRCTSPEFKNRLANITIGDVVAK